MSGNGSDPLAHIEQGLLQIQETLATIVATVERPGETTAEGFSTLTAMMVALQEAMKSLDERVKLLDSRISILDAPAHRPRAAHG